MRKKNAEALLGSKPEKKLRVGDRIRRNWLQRAMDNGATFRNKEDAEKYLRHKKEDMINLLILLVLAVLFVATAQYIDGYRVGVETMTEVCKLIVIGGI